MANPAWSNQAIKSLTVPTGATTGARIVIDGTTGMITVYNAANQLVGSWGGPNGELESFSTLSSAVAQLFNGGIQFYSSLLTSFLKANIAGGNNGAVNSLALDSGSAAVGQARAFLTLLSAAPGSEEVQAVQRGVTGSVLQSDQDNVNNLVHVGQYLFSTDASGNSTFNHGCSFTPKVGFLAGLQNANGPFYQYAWFSSPFTSTTAHANFTAPNGTGYANVTNAGLFGVFYG